MFNKENLKKMFGMEFEDHEVDLFNELMKAKEEGKDKELIISYGRQNTKQSKVITCFNVYQVMKDRAVSSPAAKNLFEGATKE